MYIGLFYHVYRSLLPCRQEKKDAQSIGLFYHAHRSFLPCRYGRKFEESNAQKKTDAQSMGSDPNVGSIPGKRDLYIQ